jgi:hypothetical protein
MPAKKYCVRKPSHATPIIIQKKRKLYIIFLLRTRSRVLHCSLFSLFDTMLSLNPPAPMANLGFGHVILSPYANLIPFTSDPQSILQLAPIVFYLQHIWSGAGTIPLYFYVSSAMINIHVTLLLPTCPPAYCISCAPSMEVMILLYLCRYPEDQVSPRTSFRSRQNVRHVNHTPPRVINLSMNRTAWGSSGVTTCALKVQRSACY